MAQVDRGAADWWVDAEKRLRNMKKCDFSVRRTDSKGFIDNLPTFKFRDSPA